MDQKTEQMVSSTNSLRCFSTAETICEVSVVTVVLVMTRTTVTVTNKGVQV